MLSKTQTGADEHSQFVLDHPQHPQPVKLLQKWRHVVEVSSREDHTCGGAEHRPVEFNNYKYTSRNIGSGRPAIVALQ